MTNPTPFSYQIRASEYEITVNILTGVVEGTFPRRALRHVIDWYELQNDELLEDWALCRKSEIPKPIQPLSLDLGHGVTLPNIISPFGLPDP